VGWAETRAIYWVLPALLTVGWLVLWLTRRRVRPWFFALAIVLALLCFPAGSIAGHAETSGEDCTPDNLCFSIQEVHWWFNGMYGLLTCGVLVVLTLGVELVLAIVRRRSKTPPPREADVPASQSPAQGWNR
jgi:hypothetical protein